MYKKTELKHHTLQTLIQNSVQKYAKLPAVSFVDGTPITYAELGNKIDEIAQFFNSLGLQVGDKIALLGHNMPNWVIAYFAAVSNGYVIVPILPDFSAEEVENVISHSESKLLIITERLLSKVESTVFKGLKATVLLDDFSLISGNIQDTTLTKKTLLKVDEDDLAAIIYTSGTTGRSKGVMLTHRNLVFTASQSFNFQAINSSDVFLSLLPLSHTYENTIGMIYPILYGASIYYLQKPPTSASLLPALASIRPTMILSVPLIMEKLYKSQIQSKFTKNRFKRIIYKTPIFRIVIHRFAGKKLFQTFGGRLKFFGIGGAKIDSRVERFLKEARFPYAIGYGLTETSPLLAGASPHLTKLQSTGFAVPGVKLRINQPTKNGVGEIWAKGPNVMKGYYKNAEATAEVLTTDGWFKTGDLGRFDTHKRLYIKGRMKSTIVGASGENIYPEDIESVINSHKFVVESLVLEEDGFLVAKVLLDLDHLEQNIELIKSVVESKKEKSIKSFHELEEKHQIWVSNFKKELNSKLNRTSQIKRVDIIDEALEKTASLKIKRFLYHKTDSAKNKQKKDAADTK